MLLIFLLLYSTFHSLHLAFLIYTAVPMAATGGVFALYLRGMPFSISAGVGFIALFGVAVLNGLVWVGAVEHLAASGRGAPRSRPRGRGGPVAPILMTALVAGLGFIPMAIAITPGAGTGGSGHRRYWWNHCAFHASKYLGAARGLSLVRAKRLC